MGIFDKFSKKESKNEEEQEFEEYIEKDSTENSPKKMETTLDKVDLGKLDTEEFEAYMRNPEIFAEDTTDSEVVEDSDDEIEESVEEEKVVLPAKKVSPFGKMKVKFPNFKKEVVPEEPEIDDVEDDADVEETEPIVAEEVDLENLSLDDLEKLYDEDSEQLEGKSEIEDLTGVVSLRGVNKRFERLSEKEERRKETEKSRKKAARRKLMNGTFTLVVFGGVFYFTYSAFEQPINNFAVDSYETISYKVSSVFNKDVQEKLSNSVDDVLTKDAPVELLAVYGDTFPSDIDVKETTKEEFTIKSGNYVVGNQIPAGNYLVQGTIKHYVSDVDLSRQSPTEENSYENSIVPLVDGNIISLTGSMYPNEYRSASILDTGSLTNGVLYEVGRDVEKDAEIFVQGQGIVEYLDEKLVPISEEAINNTNTISVSGADFVRFTGVNSFSAK